MNDQLLCSSSSANILPIFKHCLVLLTLISFLVILGTHYLFCIILYKVLFICKLIFLLNLVIKLVAVANYVITLDTQLKPTLSPPNKRCIIKLWFPNFCLLELMANMFRKIKTWLGLGGCCFICNSFCSSCRGPHLLLSMLILMLTTGITLSCIPCCLWHLHLRFDEFSHALQPLKLTHWIC